MLKKSFDVLRYDCSVRILEHAVRAAVHEWLETSRPGERACQWVVKLWQFQHNQLPSQDVCSPYLYLWLSLLLRTISDMIFPMNTAESVSII